MHVLPVSPYLPLPQIEHAAAPDAEYFPAAQLVHLVWSLQMEIAPPPVLEFHVGVESRTPVIGLLVVSVSETGEEAR